MKWSLLLMLALSSALNAQVRELSSEGETKAVDKPYRAQLLSVAEPGLLDEGCWGYGIFTVWKGDEIAYQAKLCGGINLRAMKSGESIVFVADKQGGNAAGWGLYRYNPTNGKIDFHEFNAREIHITGLHGNKLMLRNNYAVHDMEKGGYKPDRLEYWQWKEGHEPELQAKE